MSRIHSGWSFPRTALSAGLLLLMPAGVRAQAAADESSFSANVTTRVSVGSSGAQGNSYGDQPSLSAGGRFVAFVKLYVRELTPEIAKTIGFDSPDHEFLNGDDQSHYYFLVMIRDGKIIDTEAATAGALKAEETGEIMGFSMKRDKKMQEMLKEATKK